MVRVVISISALAGAVATAILLGVVAHNELAISSAQTFALNMLGKDQKSLAFTFFRPADVSDGKLSGQSFRKGTTGAPILIDALGAVECRVVSIVEQGDHHIVVGEVIDAHLSKPPSGRPDSAILEMKDLAESVFYGG